MQSEQQQREEKGFQDEVAVIHRLVQTHLVTKPEDDPEYSTSEHCERAPCCSTKSSAGYRRVHPTRWGRAVVQWL